LSAGSGSLEQLLDAISKSPNPAAQYISRYSEDRYRLWDELAAAAWLGPSLITKERLVYMDIDLSHGPSYGDTLTWNDKIKPAIDFQPCTHNST
jgi:purine nucleosidase